MPNYSKIAGSLSELLAKMPKGSASAQEAIRLEMELEAARQAAMYAPHTLPTEAGAAALGQAKKTLGKAEGGIVNLDEIVQRAMQRGVPKMGVGGSIKKAAKALTHSGDNALPLMLPRANMSSDFINAQAERVARQMLGEHVKSGKPKDTKNLAGRSMKEQERVKKLDYKLTPYGTVAQEGVYKPTKGDMIVSFPGDQTVSNRILEELEGFPIDSPQEGGAYYGLGQKHLDEPEFWKSTEVPAKNVQAKVDRLADAFEPNRIVGSHLAMGPMSNNFAMHFADANLRAIDWSKADPDKINKFDTIIANGYKDPKTKEIVTFPHWPGVADREAAMEVMKSDSALRKWFNNRMKVPKVTQPLGLPNGLDIQYAITEPLLRDMEINMTGLMTGDLQPGALVEEAGNPHNTYSHRILGEAIGPQEVLTPFVISNPDAAQHIATTKNPSDFTGTIQKVFPHQLVDDQYINQFNEYRERIKQLTGKKKGGLAVGGVPERRDVSQLFPLNPKLTGEVTEDGSAPGDVMFKPKPLQIPSMFSDIGDALKSQFNKERRSMSKPGAVSDVLLRGPAAFAMGAPSDIAEMGSNALDYLQTKIPALRKPASVMDTGPEITPPMGYAPKMQLSPEGQMPYGTEHAQELMKRAGMTSGEERPMFEMGSALAAPLAPKAGKLALKGAKALAPTAAEMALDIATKYGVDPRMNVVKPKGGNWLAGTVEDTANKLKVKYGANQGAQQTLDQMNEVYNPDALALMSEENRASVTRHFPQLQREAILEKWIDQKLNKYIKNEMGTPEDSIRLGIERRAVEAEKLREANEVKLAKMQANIDKAKAEGKNTTLSENDLEAAKEKFNDEYEIASRGLYHGTVPIGGWAEESLWEPQALGYARQRAGFPEKGMATHPAAKNWEILSDQEIRPINLSSVLVPPDKRWGTVETDILKENPWIEKVVKENPEAIGYELDTMSSDVNLEFRHMIDEVKEAMNPETILPKSLRITPKDLEKMTVDDVSALSGKISAWRDIQKTKADLQVANNPATHTFKEYPENNPKGLSWKQIKWPEGLPDEEAEKAVRAATKYEGDIMRHCVGGAGHCEPLLQDEVELYTLRDAKGEPHVTIEVEPPKKYTEDDVYEQFPGGVQDAMKNKTLQQYIETKLTELNNQPSRILEIKGKNNKKPNPEYIPFIQDFVKSGNFKSVGDSAHADMYQPNPSTLSKFMPENPELQNIGQAERLGLFNKAQEAGELNYYLTREDWENILLKYSKQKGYAQGGEVRMANGGAVNLDDIVAQSFAKSPPINLDDIVSQAFTKNYAEGGAAYNTTPDMADGGQFIQGEVF